MSDQINKTVKLKDLTLQEDGVIRNSSGTLIGYINPLFLEGNKLFENEHIKCNIATDEQVERARHEEMLKNDPKYAERMIFIMKPVGHRFSVSLQTVDPYGTIKLFESLYSKEPNPVLVAGCIVTQIGFHDMSDKYDELNERHQQFREDIQNVLNDKLTSKG